MNITKKPFVIFIEPVAVHWSHAYSLAHHFLSRGWEVLVCGPKSLGEGVFFRIQENPNINRYNFLPLGFKTILKIAFGKKWQALSISTRVFMYKWKFFHPAFIRYIITQIFFLVIIIRSLNRCLVMWAIFQVEFLADPGKKTFMFYFKNPFFPILSRLLIKASKVINVMDESIRDTIKQQRLTNLPIVVSPSCIYQPKPLINRSIQKNKFRVIIPGRIDLERRDYRWLRDIPNNLRSKIFIALAGRAKSNKERKLFQIIRELGYDCPSDLSGEYVSEERFDELMFSADILLAPVLQFIIKGISILQIGKDKSTGALHDAIQYGKPLLLPQICPVGKKYYPNVVYYKNNADLIRQLTLFIDNPQKLKDIHKRAVNNSLCYTAEKLDYLDELSRLNIFHELKVRQ